MNNKVSFFLPSFNIGGIECVFINYANALSNHGYSVDFVVCKSYGVLKNCVAPQVNIVSLGNIQLRFSFLKLRSYIKSSQSNAIITGGDFPNIVLILSSLLLRKRSKIIISQHNYYNIEVKQLGLWARSIKFLMKRLYPCSDVLIAVSQGILSDISQKIKLKSNQLCYLPNPIDINRILQKGEAELPLYVEKYIVFIGRLSAVKNLKLLLSAFDLMECQEFKLLIVGDGFERCNLETYSKSLRRCDQILFIGAVSNPMPYLKKATALALPSFSEALPTVLLEALAYNIPIVSTPNPGALEILNGARNAYISNEFNNSQEFAELLDRAIEHKVEDDSQLLERYLMNNILPRFMKLIEK